VGKGASPTKILGDNAKRVITKDARATTDGERDVATFAAGVNVTSLIHAFKM
jgi:hypothetical protein